MRTLLCLLLVTLAHAQRPVAGAGTIRGTVRWIGPRPDLSPPKDSTESAACKKAASRRLVIGSGGGVADAVVWLEGIKDIGPGKPGTARIEHEACALVPRVQVAPVGSRIELRNLGPDPHEVRSAEEDEGPPLSLKVRAGKGKKARSKPLGEPGIVELVCDSGHAPARAFVHLVQHPFYEVTETRGTFEFSGVPPGAYYLRLWHPGWAGKPVLLHQEVDVDWGTKETLDFKLRDF